MVAALVEVAALVAALVVAAVEVALPLQELRLQVVAMYLVEWSHASSHIPLLELVWFAVGWASC